MKKNKETEKEDDIWKPLLGGLLALSLVSACAKGKWGHPHGGPPGQRKKNKHKHGKK